MRFAGPDVVLFAVGALLFSGSVYGLVATGGIGGGDSAIGAYSITWSTSTTERSITEFGTETSVPFNFTIDETGVTVVTVVVDCAHAAGVPNQVSTTVTVEVAGPNNLTGSGSGACGEAVEVDIPVAEVPEGNTLQASSQEEAEQQARDDIVGSAAAGEWTGEATFNSRSADVGAPTLVEYSGEIALTLTLAEPSASPLEAR